MCRRWGGLRGSSESATTKALKASWFGAIALSALVVAALAEAD